MHNEERDMTELEMIKYMEELTILNADNVKDMRCTITDIEVLEYLKDTYNLTNEELFKIVSEVPSEEE